MTPDTAPWLILFVAGFAIFGLTLLYGSIVSTATGRRARARRRKDD